jgi:hypothetical protein
MEVKAVSSNRRYLISMRRQWHDDEVHIKGRGHSAAPRHPQWHM